MVRTRTKDQRHQSVVANWARSNPRQVLPELGEHAVARPFLPADYQLEIYPSGRKKTTAADRECAVRHCDPAGQTGFAAFI
jgi:hypothetical protein